MNRGGIKAAFVCRIAEQTLSPSGQPLHMDRHQKAAGMLMGVDCGAGQWVCMSALSNQPTDDCWNDSCLWVSVQSDYCIGIDRQWTIDGREEAKKDTFCLPHINHSSTRSNLARRTLRKQRKVAFVTAKPIQVQLLHVSIGVAWSLRSESRGLCRSVTETAWPWPWTCKLSDENWCMHTCPSARMSELDILP